MSDIFDLLDESLDNLSDLEKFEPIPAGAHLATLAFHKEDSNGLPVVVMGLTLVETLELANSTDAMPEPGKKINLKYFLKMKDKQTQEVVPNKIGQGQLKEILRVLQETAGGTSPNEVMVAAEGMQVAVTLKVRASKDDVDIKFNTIKAITVA
jgi:hypothetical protein